MSGRHARPPEAVDTQEFNVIAHALAEDDVPVLFEGILPGLPTSVSVWYPPTPERHFVIAQPTDRRALPKIHVYLVCGFKGCETRFFLPDETPLRELGQLASESDWQVGLGADVRCPDHHHGEPLKLMPATLDPTDTVTEKQLSDVLAELSREEESA